MPDRTITVKNADSQRSKRDRRLEDAHLGSVKRERRIGVERRLPVVDEMSISFSEWVRSMAIFQAKIRKRSKANDSEIAQLAAAL